jgi:dienelactone hydrolase
MGIAASHGATMVRTVANGDWAAAGEWVNTANSSDHHVPALGDNAVLNNYQSATVSTLVPETPNAITVNNQNVTITSSSTLTITSTGSLAANPSGGAIYVGVNDATGIVSIASGGSLSGASLAVGNVAGARPSTLEFTLDAAGFATPVAVSGAFTIRTNQNLVINASAYAGGGGAVELVTYGSRSGSFDPSRITIIGLEGASIDYDSNSMNLVVSDLAANLAAVLALGNLTNAPVLRADDTTMATTNVAAGTMKAIYYDALDYSGSPTRVYAYVGIPPGASAGSPVPGVVLVHGGGGTAFSTWVQKWMDRGYAAISIAVEGQTDSTTPPTMNTGWHIHNMPGPVRVGIYGDTGNALTNQWMYHAVADTVLANSLMRSLPEVDASKVGMMGISWGGVIASTVMGTDDRFAFSIPTYGCGHLYDVPNQYGAALGNNDFYKQVWDPMVRMANATMPALWFSWPKENNFSHDSQGYTYHAATNSPRMVSLVPGMGHGHPPAWNRPESYDFADSIVDDGAGWCLQESASLSNGVARVVFTSTKPLNTASLIYTTGTGYTGALDWPETNVTTLLESPAGTWTVTASVPTNATAWFVNVKATGSDINNLYGYSDTNLIASSDYQEIINLILSPSSGLHMNHPLPSTQTTGTVAVAFTAPTNVEITNALVQSQSHPGAFTSLATLPWVLTSPYPATASLPIRFDNTIAGLSAGQTATGLVAVVWKELDGTTNAVQLPVTATAIAPTPYSAWASQYGLDQINVNTNADLNTVSVPPAERLYRDSIGFHKSSASAWTVSEGVLGNASTSNDNVGEGALGRMIDLSAFTNLGSSQLTLSFDYTTADPGEILYVHLWGYVDVSSTPDTFTMNLGAANGAAWESAGGAMTAYNLGKPNGIFTGTPGLHTDAAAILTGSSGSQTYSNTFDLSGYSTAPNTVSGYDYVTLGFARNLGGSSSAVTIRNVVLAGDGGDVLMAFVQNQPADALTSDPDLDFLNNLLEYGLGGNPTNAVDVGIHPFGRVGPDGVFQYIHRRRVDAEARGLTYTPEGTSDLLAGPWSTNGLTEAGTAAIDAEFESVTNQLQFGDIAFGRLKIELAE